LAESGFFGCLDSSAAVKTHGHDLRTSLTVIAAMAIQLEILQASVA
jgi:hypothetical protein